MRVETISTGALDLALWWYPKGRVVEIYGPESSGKPLTLHAIAEAEEWRCGGFCDAEHASILSMLPR